MAKKEKKISISAFDEVMKTEFDNTAVVDWHGLELAIKRNLSVSEAKGFINGVIDVCLPEGGEYTPELYDIAIRGNVLAYYTNVTIPSSIEHLYDMIYRTDIYNTVLENINTDQFEDMMFVIKEKCHFIINTGINDVNKRLENVVSAFEGIQSTMEEVYSGMSPDDVSSVIKALSDNGFDKDKVVKLVLDDMRSNND